MPTQGVAERVKPAHQHIDTARRSLVEPRTVDDERLPVWQRSRFDLASVKGIFKGFQHNNV